MAPAAGIDPENMKQLVITLALLASVLTSLGQTPNGKPAMYFSDPFIGNTFLVSTDSITARASIGITGNATNDTGVFVLTNDTRQLFLNSVNATNFYVGNLPVFIRTNIVIAVDGGGSMVGNRTYVGSTLLATNYNGGSVSNNGAVWVIRAPDDTILYTAPSLNTTNLTLVGGMLPVPFITFGYVNDITGQLILGSLVEASTNLQQAFDFQTRHLNDATNSLQLRITTMAASVVAGTNASVTDSAFPIGHIFAVSAEVGRNFVTNQAKALATNSGAMSVMTNIALAISQGVAGTNGYLGTVTNIAYPVRVLVTNVYPTLNTNELYGYGFEDAPANTRYVQIGAVGYYTNVNATAAIFGNGANAFQLSNSVNDQAYFLNNSSIPASKNWEENASTGAGFTQFGTNYTTNIFTAFWNTNLAGYGDSFINVNAYIGSDAAGTRNGFPFKTIAAAFSKARPWDTIFIANGTYTESVNIAVPRNVSVIGESASGTFLKEITFQLSDNNTFRNFEMTGGYMDGNVNSYGTAGLTLSFVNIRNRTGTHQGDAVVGPNFEGSADNCIFESASDTFHYVKNFSFDGCTFVINGGNQIGHAIEVVNGGSVFVRNCTMVVTNMQSGGAFGIAKFGSATTFNLTVDGTVITHLGTDMLPTGTAVDSVAVVTGGYVDNGTNIFTSVVKAPSVATVAAKPVAVTVGASPFTFLNATSDNLECFLSGGTAYAVAKNGATVYASLAGDAYLVIQPTNRVTVTYTVAPTMLTNRW